MASFAEEIFDEQIAFLEACEEALAELGQEWTDDAQELDEAFWSCMASLLQD